jgi:O-antigen ligase
MRAEQTLTASKERGARTGPGGGALQSSRGRLDQIAAAAPIALLVGLALAGGGFEIASRHIAGLATWLVVVALLVFGAASAAQLRRPFYWTAGSILGLSLLSAISSLWSGSVELSVIEADRVLVYLSFFLAAFLIAQTNERRQRFAEGLVISLAAIALLGLASRLVPHVLQVSDSLGTGPRLRYPLGYWNANGAVFGIGIALLLWSSRQATSAIVRWLSVAVMPAVLLALYFTYSRGGLLALLVAAGCLIALSRDRLWLTATLAIGALGALPAVLAVQARRDLADNLPTQAVIDQGVTVLLILLAGTALALALFAGLRQLERRDGQLTGKALALSRHPTFLKGVAAAVAIAAIVAMAAVGGRAWDQFSSSDIQFPDRPEQHFSQLNGAGRHDFWRVATDTFDEKPLLGIGAGTYEFAWEEKRSIELPVHDAHSLYLEAFAELGIAGGLLVLVLVGSMLWAGFGAWRNAIYPQRERYAALFAAMLAFAIGAAFDWFWELAAIGVIFFLAGGVLVAARCAQLGQARAAANGQTEGRRYGLAIVGLAVAWIAAIALVGPLLVDREISASRNAAAEGDIGMAIDHAKRARSIEPWAASPYVQLGLLAQLNGEYETAAIEFSHAINREDHNWQWYYLRSKVEHEGGDDVAAAEDLRKARELNPVAECLRSGWECG